jgi:aerobic-type carbon monoxide dehydrogenase small subunit (CoxS/CutS family)
MTISAPSDAPAQWLPPDGPVDLELRVNGGPLPCRVPARHTLADALREAGLTGTRLGCDQGSCGTCTVLLDGRPVRSCTMLAIQAEGAEVETVEGLATRTPEGCELHPVQQAFADGDAMQCGFCTPGFLMLACGLLRSEPDADEDRIREVISANLCRCTGGPPVVRAVLEAQRRMQESAEGEE